MSELCGWPPTCQLNSLRSGKQKEDRRGNCTNCNRQPLLANARHQIQDVVHAADMVIGRQPAGSNRQTMIVSQALRSPGDPAHNPGQGDEAINKPSTSCASMKTATTMTRSNTWNLTLSKKMTGETRFL